jgi:hypothetical protein
MAAARITRTGWGMFAALRRRRTRSGAEKIVIEDAKTNARHRCAEDHQDIEVVPGKNLQIKNSHAKEAHARGYQNQ